MKSTAEQREFLRSHFDRHSPSGYVVHLVLDDLAALAREIEDARDRMQKMELELGAIRGQMPGGEL